jgi:hypothetical protein
MNNQNIKSQINYIEQYPKRCCKNCACFSESNCLRIQAIIFLNNYYHNSNYNLFNNSEIISECGLCDKWISNKVKDIYLNSSSFEEFKIKSIILSDNSFLEELENSFCEKKATSKMLNYIQKILSVTIYSDLKLSQLPLDAYFNTNDNEIQFKISDSFYLIQKWISENEFIYMEYLKKDNQSKINIQNIFNFK